MLATAPWLPWNDGTSRHSRWQLSREATRTRSAPERGSRLELAPLRHTLMIGREQSLLKSLRACTAWLREIRVGRPLMDEITGSRKLHSIPINIPITFMARAERHYASPMRRFLGKAGGPAFDRSHPCQRCRRTSSVWVPETGRRPHATREIPASVSPVARQDNPVHLRLIFQCHVRGLDLGFKAMR
jgi:hypothetical protein